MKKIIKIFSFALIIALVVSIFPSCDKKEEKPFVLPTRQITDDAEYTEGDYRYMLYNDDTAAIIEHTGNESEIVIPETLGGYKVVTIGSGAFYWNQNVTSVTIPDTVETIGSSAFDGCMKLETINIPKTVWDIYPSAFLDTPWLNNLSDKEFVIVGDSVLLQYNGTRSNVVIPDTVKHISAAFYGNQIVKNVTIPDSVYTIGCAAFGSSTLSRVEIGKNVVSIGDSAFNACSELYYINMPDSVKRIENYAFYACTGLHWLKIGKGVEYIAMEAFYRASSINYIYLPKSLLKKDAEGNYEKTIDDFAFGDCDALKYVFFEGSAEEFENLDVSGANSYLADAAKIYNYNY